MAKFYGFGSQCFQSLDLYSYFCCAALPLNLGGLGRQLALGGGGLILSHRLLLASKVTPGTIYRCFCLKLLWSPSPQQIQEKEWISYRALRDWMSQFEGRNEFEDG